jgi:hypothetical protein
MKKNSSASGMVTENFRKKCRTGIGATIAITLPLRRDKGLQAVGIAAVVVPAVGGAAVGIVVVVDPAVGTVVVVTAAAVTAVATVVVAALVVGEEEVEIGKPNQHPSKISKFISQNAPAAFPLSIPPRISTDAFRFNPFIMELP